MPQVGQTETVRVARDTTRAATHLFKEPPLFGLTIASLKRSILPKWIPFAGLDANRVSCIVDLFIA